MKSGFQRVAKGFLLLVGLLVGFFGSASAQGNLDPSRDATSRARQVYGSGQSEIFKYG